MHAKEYLNNLKIPTASSKNFPSRQETDSSHHVCLTKQFAIRFSTITAQAQNSTCLKQEFSITKENRQCKPCMPNKTIQLLKNSWTSSKFQLPRARIFHHQTKQSAIQLSKNRRTSSKLQLPQARIFHHERKQTV